MNWVRGEVRKRRKHTSSLSAGKAANGSSTFSFITCSSSWKPHVVKIESERLEDELQIVSRKYTK